MKSLFVILLTGLMSLNVFAQETLHGSLEDLMKQMGDNFKAIGSTIDDPSKNQNNVLRAADLRSICIKSLPEVPHKISEMPAEKQPENLRTYQSLMAQLLLLSVDLEKSLQANDNVGAKAIVVKMAELRKAGHDLFK